MLYSEYFRKRNEAERQNSINEIYPLRLILRQALLCARLAGRFDDTQTVGETVLEHGHLFIRDGDFIDSLHLHKESLDRNDLEQQMLF